MSLLRPPVRSRREPIIGLINVVFLMLIFFLIAGSIAPAPERGLALVRIADLTTQAPPDALVLSADGTLRHAGAEGVDPAAYVATLPAPRVARILPDRDAPAAALVALADALHRAGADRVIILGERALP